jgi:hypothetical protein
MFILSFNKIRDKGTTVPAGKQGGKGGEGWGEEKGRRWQEGVRNDPNIVYTYE